MIRKKACRRILPLIIVVLLISIWPLPTIFSQSDDITIDNKNAASTESRTGVEFPHAIHTESYDCLDCHHDYHNGENVLDEGELEEDGSAACNTCHTSSATIDLQTAYHRQCMTCHRAVNREPEFDLPITCKDCHPKELSDG